MWIINFQSRFLFHYSLFFNQEKKKSKNWHVRWNMRQNSWRCSRRNWRRHSHLPRHFLLYTSELSRQACSLIKLQVLRFVINAHNRASTAPKRKRTKTSSSVTFNWAPSRGSWVRPNQSGWFDDLKCVNHACKYILIYSLFFTDWLYLLKYVSFILVSVSFINLAKSV